MRKEKKREVVDRMENESYKRENERKRGETREI